jgi:prophage DNA circulation protein
MTAEPKPTNWSLLLQVGQIALLIAGGTLVYLERVDAAQSAAGTVSQQLADLRVTVRDGIAGIQSQISGLPDQRAAIEALARRANDADTHLSALDARATTDERMLYQVQTATTALQSTVDGIVRASGPVRNPR